MPTHPNENTAISFMPSRMKGYSPTASEELKLRTIVRDQILLKRSEPYMSAKIRVKAGRYAQEKTLVVYLLRADTYTAEVIGLTLDANDNVTAQEMNYVDEEDEGSARKTLDLEAVDFVCSTPVPEIPTAKAAVEAIAALTQAMGLRTKILLGPDASVANYKALLSSGSLKGFLNIGHGNTYCIVLDDGMLTANWFQSLTSRPVFPAVVYFNSCLVFNPPLQPAIMDAGARTFIGGKVNLLIGPSEEVAKAFWKQVMTESQPMGDAIIKAEQDHYPERDAHGISGDLKGFAASLFETPELVVPNFGYEAGGWRVEMHPRFLADLTGDGRADIVGFGGNGVHVALSRGDGTFTEPRLVLAHFGYEAGGWRVDRHPRFLADLTGDSRADIIGFGNDGVLVALRRGDGTFAEPRLVLANFGYEAGGWRVEKHPRFLADVTGDRRADIVGFGGDGVIVALSRGDGTFTEPRRVLSNFGYEAGGWRVEKHPRFLADVTGEGRADIVGFGGNGVHVALSRGDGTFTEPRLVLANFGYEAGGWRVDRHPRFLADLTGEGRADIVGFGGNGVHVALSRGDGTFTEPRLVLSNFGYEAGGWRVEKHPRFLADVNGDGRADIVGFGDAGVFVALSRGDGTFASPELVIPDFGYEAGGWRVEKHPRFLADVTGDSRADIVGFGDAGVIVAIARRELHREAPVRQPQLTPPAQPPGLGV